MVEILHEICHVRCLIRCRDYLVLYYPRGFPFSFLYLVLPTNDRTIKMMHAIFGLHVTEVSAMLHKTSYLFCVIVSALYAPVTMIIMYCMLSCQWFEIQS